MAWGCRVAAVLLMPFLFASGSSATKHHELQLAQYLDWEQVENPQISPDGERIIYTRSRVNKLHDRWDSNLWIVNSDGTDDRYFGPGSSPVWSLDGEQVAYLQKDNKENTQIFTQGLGANGSTRQVTHLDRAPDTIAWSPDSQTIAFTMFVPKTREIWDINLPGRPDGAKWTEEPRILTRLVYRIDRLSYVEDGYFQIFTIPAGGGEPKQLTDGEFDHGGGSGFGGNMVWTPDGKEIIFASFHTEDWEYIWRRSDLYALDVTTKAVRQITRRDGPDQDPAVSPDGRWIAYTGFDTNPEAYTVPSVYAIGIDGTNPRALSSSLDRSPYSSPYGSSDLHLHWAPDSSGVYFNIDDRGTRNLYFSPLQGRVRQATLGTHVLTVTGISKKGTAAAVVSDYYKSPNIVIFDVSRPVLKQLTFVNDGALRETTLGTVEDLWYESTDGLRIQGWIITPPNFNPKEKYPLVLNIHGGPHAMYDVSFNFALQEFAAKGFVVLYTNPRGSTGYGAAFANAIKNAYPGKDFDDLMRGVDEVVARGYVNPQNLFVYGCSGGGVLTAWIVGHTDRFAGASANCAVTNWLSFVGTTDAVEFYDTFSKRPWEDATEYLRRSPLMYAGNVKTPTMLMTGELDMDTPIGQAEEFYRALKLRGIPTVLIRFNDEFHGTSSKPSNFVRTQLYLQHWFNKYKRRPSPSGETTAGDNSGRSEH